MLFLLYCALSPIERINYLVNVSLLSFWDTRNTSKMVERGGTFTLQQKGKDFFSFLFLLCCLMDDLAECQSESASENDCFTCCPLDLFVHSV